MKWWQIRKREDDLQRELQSDLELEEEEQQERGLPVEDARYAVQRSHHLLGWMRSDGARSYRRQLSACPPCRIR